MCQGDVDLDYTEFELKGIDDKNGPQKQNKVNDETVIPDETVL